MSKDLIVKHSIKIEAPVTRVWEILTKPEYIRYWGHLPEDFGDYDITPTTVIDYPEVSRLTVVEFDENKTLRYELYMPTWEEEVTDLGYTYSLATDHDGFTWLTVEIGDFAILVEGDEHFEKNLRFGTTASERIKELAEKNEVLI